MVRRYGLVALLVAASFVTLAGCGKPKAGGKCTAGQVACVDAKSGLMCGSDSTYQAVPCAGKDGCQGSGDKATCDQTIAAAGDTCPADAKGYACATDMKSALQCTSGKFVAAETCKGPGACKLIAGGEVSCDNDIADLNDPCRDKGDYACTSDKSNALQCSAGLKMGLVNTCRGPGGCKIIHQGKEVDIDCDMSIVQENDPCVIPDNEGCSLDKKTMLTCKGASATAIGKYTNPDPCPGPNGCSVSANKKTFKVTCDKSSGGGGGGGGKKGKKH
jgi:hypothetical protein